MFQGFKEFAKNFNIDKNWNCYCFEANPITYKFSQKEYENLCNEGYSIIYKNLAVSSFDGKIKINCDLAENGTGQGSNILLNPPNKDIEWGHNLNYLKDFIEVECIDFAKFINSVCNPGDYILIKMDIEGAEFDVLDSLIIKIDLSIINEIYVEFHERFFEDIDFYKEKKLKYKKLFLEKKSKFNEWK